MKFSKFVKLIPNFPSSDYYLAFNTLHLTTIAVHRLLVEAIGENRTIRSYDPPSIIQSLLEEGFLVENDIDESKIYDDWWRIQVENRQVIELTVQVTTDCNLACPYCFQEPVFGDKRVTMHELVQEKFVLWLKKAIDFLSPEIKLLDIAFYGGEALMELDMLCSLADRISKITQRKNLPILFSVITNGTLLTSDAVRRLRNSGFTKAQVTLDGPPEAHNLRRVYKDGKGSFDTIWDNLIYASSQMQVGLTINYDTTNADTIIHLLDQIIDEKLSERLLFIIFGDIIDFSPRGSSQKKLLRSMCGNRVDMAGHMANLYDQGFRRDLPLALNIPYGPCRLFLKRGAMVDVQGDIYRCIASAGIKEFKLGSIFDGKSEESLWFQSTHEFGKDIRSAYPCAQCVYLPLCGGGCRFQAYLSRNNPEARFCQKGFIDHGITRVVQYYYQKQLDNDERFQTKQPQQKGMTLIER